MVSAFVKAAYKLGIRVRYSESLLFPLTLRLNLTLTLTLTQTLTLWRVSAQWTLGIAGWYLLGTYHL